MARIRELNRIYLNDYVASVANGVRVLDMGRLNAAVASDVNIDGDGMGAVYGYTNTAGLVIPSNLGGVRVNLRGGSLRNVGSGSAQCVVSFGGWDAAGAAAPSATDCNESCVLTNAILDAGSNGAAVALRVNSGHYCKFDNIRTRNATGQGVLNLGGVWTEYNDVNNGYDPRGNTWTKHFNPENGFVSDGSPNGLGGFNPPSIVTFRKCETWGHTKDGFRFLNGNGTTIDRCAAEQYGGSDAYSFDETGKTQLEIYAAREAWGAGNHGAGFYLGPLMNATKIIASDPEYSNDYPNGGGYKMGFVIDAGARDTILEACFRGGNANIVIHAGALRTVIIGSTAGNIIANGAGVRIFGSVDQQSVTKGPSLTNYYYEGSNYGEHPTDWDCAPPMNVGGFRVGYDAFNNLGPGDTQTFPMLFHRDVAEPATNYGYMQDAGATTRLNGAVVRIGCGDVVNMLFQRVAGVDKLGAFGAAPVAQQAVGAAATDAASTLTLANNLRTALIALGWCKQ